MLDGSKVARELLSIIMAVCREWLDHFPQLQAPVDKAELSIFGMKNTRRKMEDRYGMCLDVNSLYGLKVRLYCNFPLLGRAHLSAIHC